MKPLISIVIPTYNHANFLRDALRSVCDQSFSDWEAVVVNNYSVDETVAVVESFADSRIVLENFQNNGVIAASRNRGIALARGQYVAFLDSDDVWCPDKLMRCVPYFDQGADVVCHGLRWIGEVQRDVYCGPEWRATFDELLDRGTCITTSATMVRKEILESVGCFSEDPAIVTSEDYHLWLKLAKMGADMRFIREILGEYRVHAGNQSGAVLRHLNSVLCVVNEFLPAATPGDFLVWRRLRRRRGLAYYSAGRGMQKNKQVAAASRLFFRSFLCRPLFIRTHVAFMLIVFEHIFSKFGLHSNKIG